MKIKKIAQTSGLVATVVDNLNSTSEIDALSAKQGKILNEKINDINIYSTEEIKVGTWIDGKPIYRKYIDFAMSLNDIPHNIQNIKDIVSYDIKLSYGNLLYTIPNYTIEELGVGVTIIKTTASQVINGRYVGFIEYTKTID